MTDQKNNLHGAQLPSNDAQVNALTALLMGTHLNPQQASTLIAVILAGAQVMARFCLSPPLGRTSSTTFPSPMMQVPTMSSPEGLMLAFSLDGQSFFSSFSAPPEIPDREDMAPLVIGVASSIYHAADSYDNAIEQVHKRGKKFIPIASPNHKLGADGRGPPPPDSAGSGMGNTISTSEMSRQGSGIDATAISALPLIVRAQKKICGHGKYI
ncbi:hypothetical protein EV421DRAFT_1742101 [Armillaria borealis]|uniref:Uncharacterized protein n=1 Tax=Armillaria borealis TaxID=47425 RepID=A0AA39IZU1_9AGAR|nr:hypothetical protein EV421DRAFT_1742101 [Armillaria borealis]